MKEKISKHQRQISKSNKNGVATILIVLSVVFILVMLIVVGFYFFNFNGYILKNNNWSNIFQNLSHENGDWGTFGDYIGGILNPIVAIGALILITLTYNLQKSELAKTIELLEVSTDAQDKQIRLAAITALLNTNYTKLNLLEREHLELLERLSRSYKPENFSDLLRDAVQNTPKKPSYLELKVDDVKNKTKVLKDKIVLLEKQLEEFADINVDSEYRRMC